MRGLLVSLVVLCACHAPVGVREAALAPDTTPRCESQCQSIGLDLDSVVIMAAHVGCVCRPAAPPVFPGAPGASSVGPTSSARPASTAGGVTAVMLADEAARQQQQQQQLPSK